GTVVSYMDGVKHRCGRHRRRSKFVRAAAVLAGFVVVLAGLAMVPLPGPGLLVTAAGLALLALEFVWAERVLERTIDHMGKATDRVKRAGLAQRLIIGLLGVIVAAAAVTAAYAWDIPLLPV